MGKLWTINAQINTIYFSKKSSWEKPFRNDRKWQENIYMTAVSDNPDDQIVSGSIDNFNLTVNAGDTIQWIISELNPVHSKKINICMYGLIAGENWKKNLPNIKISHNNIILSSVKHYFNSAEKPTAEFISLDFVNTSIPSIEIINKKLDEKISYNINIALVNIENIMEPEILNYMQLDSYFFITPSM